MDQSLNLDHYHPLGWLCSRSNPFAHPNLASGDDRWTPLPLWQCGAWQASRWPDAAGCQSHLRRCKIRTLDIDGLSWLSTCGASIAEHRAHRFGEDIPSDPETPWSSIDPEDPRGEMVGHWLQGWSDHGHWRAQQKVQSRCWVLVWSGEAGLTNNVLVQQKHHFKKSPG